MSSSLIEVTSVTKSFGPRPVIQGLSFAVQPGEIVGLLGPNGSGKTTTVRLMNGVIHPDGGSVRVAGLDPVREGDEIRRLSGVLTETAGFYLHMSGLENLLFFGRLYGVSDPQRAAALLEEFGLGPHRHQKAGTYSTGMKRRLGLAKALLHAPRILFLDEPTNGLDPEGIRMVLAYIRELNRRDGTATVLCSHLLEQLETVCQRYLFLDRGRLIEQGTLPELEARYRSDITLEVDTNLALAGPDYQGVPARRLENGRVAFTLPSRESVPGLLRQVLAEADVYGAALSDTDLSSIYFKIREAALHE